MKNSSFHILRVGLAIVFLWIGVLIFKSPEGWGTLIQPWAAGLLPFPLETAMIGTAILDIIIGFLLLIDIDHFVLVGSLLGGLQVLGVLIVTGINDITVRDIAILAACLAFFINSLPKKSS